MSAGQAGSVFTPEGKEDPCRNPLAGPKVRVNTREDRCKNKQKTKNVFVRLGLQGLGPACSGSHHQCGGFTYGKDSVARIRAKGHSLKGTPLSLLCKAKPSIWVLFLFVCLLFTLFSYLTIEILVGQLS